MKGRPWLVGASLLCVALLAFLVLGRPPTVLRGFEGRVVAKEPSYYSNYVDDDTFVSTPEMHNVQYIFGKVEGVTMKDLAIKLQERFPVKDGWNWRIYDSLCYAHGPKGELTLSPRSDGAISFDEYENLNWLQVAYIRLTHSLSNPFRPYPTD